MSENKDDWNSHWNNFGDVSEINPAVKYRQDFLIKLLKAQDIKSTDVLIDIGCGTGSFLRQLEQTNPGYRLIGLEPSVSGCEIARRNLHAEIFQVNVLTDSLLQSELREIADIGICSEVIEHVDDPTEFLHRSGQFLKASGILLVTVPGGFRSAYDKHIGHRQHFSKASLKKSLLEAGYQNIQIYRAGFPVFNLYKILTIIAGKRLIKTASKLDGQNSKVTSVISKAFNALFIVTVSDSPFGWQLIATARK
jgi:SAM-dependent methyltransferase